MAEVVKRQSLQPLNTTGTGAHPKPSISAPTPAQGDETQQTRGEEPRRGGLGYRSRDQLAGAVL